MIPSTRMNKEQVLTDPVVQKAAATSVASAGASIALVNEYLTFVAIVVSIIAGGIAIYRGVRDIRADRRDGK